MPKYAYTWFLPPWYLSWQRVVTYRHVALGLGPLSMHDRALAQAGSSKKKLVEDLKAWAKLLRNFQLKCREKVATWKGKRHFVLKKTVLHVLSHIDFCILGIWINAVTSLFYQYSQEVLWWRQQARSRCRGFFSSCCLILQDKLPGMMKRMFVYPGIHSQTSTLLTTWYIKQKTARRKRFKSLCVVTKHGSLFEYYECYIVPLLKSFKDGQSHQQSQSPHSAPGDPLQRIVMMYVIVVRWL